MGGIWGKGSLVVGGWVTGGGEVVQEGVYNTAWCIILGLSLECLFKKGKEPGSFAKGLRFLGAAFSILFSQTREFLSLATISAEKV